jgi:uroporphyrinogen-III synthase
MCPPNPFPSLVGKNIVVTQSEPSNTNLLQQLQFCQAQTISLPTSVVTPKKLSPFSLQIASQATCWVFQSSNAARACFPALSDLAFDKTIVAIGPSTEQTLQDLGVHVDLVPETQYDSKGISNLAYFHEQSGRNVVLFSGKQSFATLEKDLRGLGHLCKKVPTHHYNITPLTALQDTLTHLPEKIDAITSHSLTNLQHLTQLMLLQTSNWLRHTTLLVVSPKMAEYAEQKKLARTILLAENPTGDAITRALNEWFTEQGAHHDR